MGVRFYRAEWSTNCERVALALALKGIEAESVWIDYSERSLVEEISGQPLVPVLDDGGTVLHDSTAILQHLDATHPEPELYPSDPRAHTNVEEFVLWFNDAWKQWSLGIEAQLLLVAGREGGVERSGSTLIKSPEGLQALLDQLDGEQRLLVDDYAAQMTAALDQIEARLAGRPDEFLIGDTLSAADLVAFPFVKYALMREPGDDELFHVLLDHFQSVAERPALAAWITRMNALPRA